jgi:hypothetical protein
MRQTLTLLKKTRRAISPTVVSYFTTDNKQVLMSYKDGLSLITAPDFCMHVETQGLTMGGNILITGRDENAVPVQVLVALE